MINIGLDNFYFEKKYYFKNKIRSRNKNSIRKLFYV